MPHETQLTSLGTICGSFRLESMFLSTGAGPGLSSMSRAKSKSKRLMYIRLFSNRRCGLHVVGRGFRIISLPGTQQLHHGRCPTPPSWRVNAAKLTTTRRVNLHFILDNRSSTLTRKLSIDGASVSSKFDSPTGRLVYDSIRLSR